MGYDGPNNRRYEKKQWAGLKLLSAAAYSVLRWLGFRKRV